MSVRGAGGCEGREAGKELGSARVCGSKGVSDALPEKAVLE